MSSYDDWQNLRAFTPARVALGRAGNGLPTARVLEFELAHAKARDAVRAPFDPSQITQELAYPTIELATAARDRTTYLANPDLGRMLAPASRAALDRDEYDAVMVIADGLSATAVHAHAAAFARMILTALPSLIWAPVALVVNGRVGVGDAVAQALGARMVAVLIGERPGLSAADSLGVYLTLDPHPGITKDADRNCISNIRPDGLPLAEAAHRLVWLMTEARRLGRTGVALKEDAPALAVAGPPA